MPRCKFIEARKLLNRDLIAKQHTYKTDYKIAEMKKSIVTKPLVKHVSVGKYAEASISNRHQEICLQSQDCQVIA